MAQAPRIGAPLAARPAPHRAAAQRRGHRRSLRARAHRRSDAARATHCRLQPPPRLHRRASETSARATRPVPGRARLTVLAARPAALLRQRNTAPWPLPRFREYAGIFVLAVSFRILHLLTATPSFESQYWALSTSLLNNGSLSIGGVRTAAFEPGYPLFLALARTLLGDKVLLVQAVQCIVASLGAVFLCRLATALSGRWPVGVIAGMIYAAYPLLVRHSADRTDAALMTMLLIAFANEFVAATTRARVAAAGVWPGLAVLTRAMGLPLIPLGAAIQCRTRGWAPPAAPTLSALIVIAPSAIRNYTLNGALLPTRSGINLFISNCEYAANILPDYGPDILEDYAVSVLEPLGTTPVPASPAIERTNDVLWTRYALEEMRRHPWRTAGLKMRNVLYFFSPWLVPYHEPSATTKIHLCAWRNCTAGNT